MSWRSRAVFRRFLTLFLPHHPHRRRCRTRRRRVFLFFPSDFLDFCSESDLLSLYFLALSRCPCYYRHRVLITIMTLPTPPSTVQRNKENMKTPSKRGIAWSKAYKIHNIVGGTPPLLTIVASASKGTPKKSILKPPTTPILPLLLEEPREPTPEPQEPALDTKYLASCVKTIVEPDPTLRELIEGYSVLAARLRGVIEGAQPHELPDWNWPLFLPLRLHKDALLEAFIRDLGRALVDPFASKSLGPESGEEECVEEKPSLPSPEKSPKKKRGMSAERVKYARDLCTTTHSVIKFLAIIFTMPSMYQLFNGSFFQLEISIDAPLINCVYRQGTSCHHVQSPCYSSGFRDPNTQWSQNVCLSNLADPGSTAPCGVLIPNEGSNCLRSPPCHRWRAWQRRKEGLHQ